VFLVGRADQMINTGGEKTAPWEVEMALRAHPAVTDAAVLGVPDGILGEVPRGYVVLAGGSDVSEEALRQHCARLLEPFKVPRKIVFLAQLPKTSLGKTSLQALRGLETGGGR
jgi:fatty-acyl-CoA synthase